MRPLDNNLRDFGRKKERDHLDAVTDRFAGIQVQCLNVHVDFVLLQRIACPSPSVRSAEDCEVSRRGSDADPVCGFV
jgi:hypothetical protein